MNWKPGAFCSNGGNNWDHLVGDRKRKKHYCWEMADAMINSRFLLQIIGEMDTIQIIQTRNILGKEDKEFKFVT